MKSKTYRSGVSEANRVVRHLKLEKAAETKLAMAVPEIDQLCGMDEVALADEGTLIHLAYDATRVSIDQNVKDNAAHVPTCCSKLPSGFDNK